MRKQVLIALGILLVLGCAEKDQEKQYESGCSEAPAGGGSTVSSGGSDEPTAWTVQLGTFGSDYVYAIKTHGRHIYITGAVDGFRDSSMSTTIQGTFIAKYDSNGRRRWISPLTTPSVWGVYPSSIVTDSSENVYVTGSTVVGLDGNVNAGAADFFVIKFSADGVKQWIRQLGTPSNDYSKGITSDSNGNAYVVGSTTGIFEGDSPTAGKASDIFIVKFSPDGATQWIRQIITDDTDYANSIVADSSNNIYLAVDSYSNGGRDIPGSIIRYNSSGEQQWRETLGVDSSMTRARDITVDLDDNIYVTGVTTGLDGNVPIGNSDYFVVKYNSSGIKQWSQLFGADLGDEGTSITTDSWNNVYVTGSTQFVSDPINDLYSEKIFITKLGSNGVYHWTKQLRSQQVGDTGNRDQSTGIATDSSGYAYVSINSNGRIDGKTNVGNSGNEDIFIVKYDSNGNRQ